MNITKALTHRESLGYWLNDNGLLGAGAEVGCAWGGFAAIVLKVWKGAKYFMVDPWENLPEQDYREKHDTIDYEQWYRDCQGLAARDPRVILIRKRSPDAAKDIPPGSLDWVFIDGNHDYGHVMEDLDAWYPKVRGGGLFSGHDFYTATEGNHFCQVDAAVERWMKEHGIVFSVTPCTSWWAMKN